MQDHQSSFGDRIEETLIAVILGLMTMVTFINVIVRKLFANDPPVFIEMLGLENIGLWGGELTVFMFGWLGLLGASYAVKKGSHLGVDVLINMVGAPARRKMGIFAVAICIIYSFLLLKGSWDYWANFANLPGTDGRWFPLGFEDKFRGKGWYEVESVPNPAIFGFLEGMFNQGEVYEKLPRLVPYFVLPLSMALLLFRFVESGIKIWNGDIDRVVASHEVEDEIEELRKAEGEH
ncbi:MAG: TRAP transporter small permease [Rhodobacterales bacterium]|nr:TRAP transporter small permease [Rhodobacterales bacterium]